MLNTQKGNHGGEAVVFSIWGINVKSDDLNACFNEFMQLSGTRVESCWQSLDTKVHEMQLQNQFLLCDRSSKKGWMK